MFISYKSVCILYTIGSVICVVEMNVLMLTSPIELGKDVTLHCFFTCCNETSQTYWRIENKSSSILAVSQKSKYEVWTSVDGCRLVIKTFSLIDATLNYTCFSNFDRYTTKLTLNDRNFRYIPDKKEITTEWKNELNVLMLAIRRAFPAPVCTVKKRCNVDNSFLQAFNKTVTKKVGIFYSTTIELDLPPSAGPYIVTCSVLDKEIISNEMQFDNDLGVKLFNYTHKQTSPCECSDGISKKTFLTLMCVMIFILFLLNVLIYRCISGTLESRTQLDKTSEKLLNKLEK